MKKIILLYCLMIYYTASFAGGCAFTAVNDSINPMTVNFTYIGWPGPQTYNWDFGDGSGTSFQQHPIYTYSVNGNYTVTLNTLDTNGISCTYSLNVSTSPNLGCSFILPDTATTGIPVFFSNTSLNQVSYLWNFGDGDTSAMLNPGHVFNSTGTYTVCLSSTDMNGQLCTVCHDITIISPCQFTTVANTSDDFTFYADSAITGTSVVWDLGNGTSATGFNAQMNYTPGIYIVCADWVDTNGTVVCNFCDTVSIGCTASFQYVTHDKDIYLIENANLSNPGMNYSWDFGDSYTSTGRFVSHSYILYGNYQVCLMITNNITCADTLCQTILIDTNNVSGCNANFVFIETQPYVIDIIDLSNGTNLSYLWDFGDGFSSNMPYPSHNYATTGSYNLCLTIDDGMTCTSTYCDTLSVDSLGNIHARMLTGFTVQVYSPSDFISGISKVEELAINHIYPNPTAGIIRVKFSDDAGEIHFFVRTITGNILKRGMLMTTENAVNISELPDGAYILEFRDTKDKIISKKIIKM